ncbi:hypothetical protein EV363DRAFT_1164668, partial [Boletus edulis]
IVFFTPRTTVLLIGKKIGDYEQCAFITPGIGGSLSTRHPGPNAHPTLGSTNVLEKVDEDRVEVLVHDQGGRAENAIQALKEVHPSSLFLSPRVTWFQIHPEEVAYDVDRLEVA